MDLTDIGSYFLNETFDTVLLLGNNLGLAGSIHGTRKLLHDIYELTSEDGQIIATIRDTHETEKEIHKSYHEKNRLAGRPEGLLRLRVVYDYKKGRWFKLLLLDREEMDDVLEGTRWGRSESKTTKNYGGVYGTVLKKG